MTTTRQPKPWPKPVLVQVDAERGEFIDSVCEQQHNKPPGVILQAIDFYRAHGGVIVQSQDGAVPSTRGGKQR